MVRSSVRRTAAFAATAALAVLAGAAPALAAGGGSGNAPRVLAPAGVQAAPDGGKQDSKQDDGTTCTHHGGVVSDLLEGVAHLLDGLL
jgi:hypothetical protein